MFRIKIGEKLKESNKDKLLGIEEIEKLTFTTEKEAENYLWNFWTKQKIEVEKNV